MITDSLKRKWNGNSTVKGEWSKYRVIDKPFYPYFLLNETRLKGQVKTDHKRKLPLDPVTTEKKAKLENEPIHPEEMKQEFNDINYWKISLPDISAELLHNERDDNMDLEENFNCYQYWKMPHLELDSESF